MLGEGNHKPAEITTSAVGRQHRHGDPRHPCLYCTPHSWKTGWSCGGEDSAPELDRPSAKRHPGCADIDTLLETIGPPDLGIVVDEAAVWLPTKGNTPMPSSPLAGDAPESRAKPRIGPRRAPVIRLDATAAAAFLQHCQDRPVLKPGVALRSEVAYWYRAHLFVLSLATRQQYLLIATGHGDQLVAAWKPLFLGNDARWLANLAALMLQFLCTGAPSPAVTVRTDFGALQRLLRRRCGPETHPWDGTGPCRRGGVASDGRPILRVIRRTSA